MDWTGKRVLILGAARQGTALARYLAGEDAQVILSDARPAQELQDIIESLSDIDIEWALGGHPLSLLEGIDLLCPSGGVPLTIPIIEEARRRNIPLSNDSDIFLQAAPCRVIGITGSAGKTTTTTLVGRMAQAAVKKGCAYRRAFVGGNIGNPLLQDLANMAPDDLAVLELSSFQLELMTCSPPVAALLNITPNHLDRHIDMEQYTAAKQTILKFQKPSDAAVLSREDLASWGCRPLVQGVLYSFGLHPLPSEAFGTCLRQDELWLRLPQGEQQIMDRSHIGLRGEHNLLNVLAACAIAAAAGLPPDAMLAGVHGFEGVEHRLEFVRQINGARWYNDSIATAPKRTIAAIRSFQEPLVLLAGGRDKHLPWDEFAQLAASRVDHLIVFGEAAALIQRAMEAAPGNYSIEQCSQLADAVQAASRIADSGDVVLLSPGGTSYDEFTDFAERGEKFKQLVQQL